MLAQCWNIVCESAPVLLQQWVNLVNVEGEQVIALIMSQRCRGFSSQQTEKFISPKVGSMLVQRRRRWTNIEPTLGKCVGLAEAWQVCLTLPDSPPVASYFLFPRLLISARNGNERVLKINNWIKNNRWELLMEMCVVRRDSVLCGYFKLWRNTTPLNMLNKVL